MNHLFVYQEWDAMREKLPTTEERVEKPLHSTQRSVSFSVRMQEARIKQRMSITDLAAKLGIPSRTMSQYEAGTEMPPSEMHEKIVCMLNMN